MPGPDYHGRTHLRGGTDPIPGWGVVIADTIAGLGAVGAAYEGKQGLLRVDSSPYGYMPLIYDHALEKWVSEYFQGPYIADGGGITTVSTTYPGLLGQQRGTIGGAPSWYAAGLRLQVNCSIFLTNSGAGNTTFARLAVREFTEGDSATVALWTSATEMSNVGTTPRFRSITWEAVTAGAPTKSTALLAFEGRVSAGTGTFQIGIARYRWVSA